MLAVKLILNAVFLILLMGFVSPDRTDVPEAVKRASQSVHRILTLASTQLPIMTYDLQETRELIAGECRQEGISFLMQKNCEALELCQENGGYQPQEIPYLVALRYEGPSVCYKPYNDGGTTFVASRENGKARLVTNWHVVDQATASIVQFLTPAIAVREPLKRVELLSRLQFSFVLFDSSGAVLKHFDSADMRITSMGDVVGPVKARTRGEAGIGRLIEDYVLLEVTDEEGKLGDALEAVDSGISNHQTVYALGYPDPTEGRSENSRGQNLYVSMGLTLDRENFLNSVAEALPPVSERQDPSEILNEPANYTLPQRGFVYSNVDTVSGNSGGPLLDADGKVVGLIVKSFASLQGDRPSGTISLYYPDISHELKD